MDRVRAYALLAEEIEAWRALPWQRLVARVGESSCTTIEMFADEAIQIEIRVSWVDDRRTGVAVTVTAEGSSGWRLERLEESIVIDAPTEEVEMDWLPISEETIWDMINTAMVEMSSAELRLWESASIIPEKWKQEPYGIQGEGFWVVGIIGRRVIWYNDIEDGFNFSKYTTYGEIAEYWCNQDNLQTTVKGLLRMIMGDA